MSGALLTIIIQAIAGAIGGGAAGSAMKDYSLGNIGNLIAGAVGGGVGGQILQALLPELIKVASTADIGAIISNAAGGGITGAILTLIVGMIKNKMA